MTFNNTAAWVTAHKSYPYEIKTAPTASPGPNELLVKNRAIGINPIEYKLQNSDLHKDAFQYPAIFGEDLSGEVVAVGPGVESFSVGDRVAGVAAGFLTKRSEEKSFQAYTILSTNLALKIPDSVTYETAAVFPLGLSTAAAGLFNPDYLNLHVPTEPAQKSTGKVLLVWGGASCVGSNAIQLAVAAGYEVISTASPKNFAKVRNIGASEVFDYRSSDVVSDLLQAVHGKDCVGVFDAIGLGAAPLTQEFVQKANGVNFISTAVPYGNTQVEGIAVKHIFSLSIVKNHVAKAVWTDFLPKAIVAGSFVPSPEPFIFGHGLESLQAAVDHLGTKGVSAQKLVVTLD